MKKALIIFLFFLVANVSCTVSDPEMMELLQEIKEQNDKLLQEVEAMKGQLSLLDGKYQVILASLAENKKELEALKSQIDALKGQIAQQLIKIDLLSAQLTQQGADIIKLSQEIKELKASCEELKDKIDELLEGRSPVPTNDLVAWYPFNGNANDESGNSLNGTVNGANLTTDRFMKSNKAYSFSTNQSIKIPNSSTKNLFPLTISLWYNIDQVPVEANKDVSIFKKYQAGAWNGYTIGACDCRAVSNNNQTINNGFGVFPLYSRSIQNRIVGYYGEPPFLQPNIDLNKWYHFVFTVDQSGGKIYVNGVLVQSDSWTGQSGASSNNLDWEIGGFYGSNWYKGLVDDLAIWNRVLTADEISKIYKGEKF